MCSSGRAPQEPAGTALLAACASVLPSSGRLSLKGSRQGPTTLGSRQQEQQANLAHPLLPFTDYRQASVHTRALGKMQASLQVNSPVCLRVTVCKLQGDSSVAKSRSVIIRTGCRWQCFCSKCAELCLLMAVQCVQASVTQSLPKRHQQAVSSFSRASQPLRLQKQRQRLHRTLRTRAEVDVSHQDGAVEKTGPSFKPLKDVQAIMDILPHRRVLMRSKKISDLALRVDDHSTRANVNRFELLHELQISFPAC